MERRKVAVIGGSVGLKPIDQSEYVAAFNEHFSGRNDITALDISKFVFELDGDTFKITTADGDSLDQFDIILCRGRLQHYTEILFAISRYAHLNRIPIVNDYSNYHNMSKFSQTVMMFEVKIPFIRTIFSYDKAILKKYVAAHMPGQIVAKNNHGSHGNFNYLLKGSDELGIIDENDKQYIIQPFVPNESDYRILVMGDTEPTVIERIATAETHLNNTSKGASARLVDDLPDAVMAQAKQLARMVGQSIAGVDAIYDKEKDVYVFLEINAQPQILTGAYTDRKIAQLQNLIDELR